MNKFCSSRPSRLFFKLLLGAGIFIFYHPAKAQIPGCVIACNYDVTVEIPLSGSLEFLPEYMLEGDTGVHCPGGAYRTLVQINNDWFPASGNFVFNSSHVGQTFLGSVIETNSGNSCWGEVQVTETSPLSAVFDLKNNPQMSVYPNPATHAIAVSVANTLGRLQLRVIDASGRICMHKTITNGESLDVSQLESGVYSLWMRSEKGPVSVRLFSKQ